jgi:hypothetical protein
MPLPYEFISLPELDTVNITKCDSFCRGNLQHPEQITFSVPACAYQGYPEFFAGVFEPGKGPGQ